MFIKALIFALSLGAVFAQEDREARGRIVDATGRPVEGALVKVRAVTRATGTRYGENPDVDTATKTDAAGAFIIHGQNRFIAVTVSVEATNFARAVISGLASGAEPREIKLLEGVSVIGAIVKGDQPAPHVPIRISSVEASEIFGISVAAETDDMGRFRIANLPPKQDYLFFGPLAGLRDLGALSVRRITAGPNATVLDLGEIRIEPALLLDGRIRASTNVANIRVTLGRSDVNDTIETLSDSEGRFHFAGVPAEIMGVMAAIPNHRLSMNNGSLLPAKPDRLLGRMVTNKADLILEFEPGAELAPLNMDSVASRQEPLLGAESETPLPDSIKVTGTVLDAETKAPLRKFTVSEGRYNRGGEVDWFFTRERVYTNGNFSLYLPPGPRAAAILIGADDHVASASGKITAASILNFELRRGVQARGFVQQTNGEPAANMVVHLASTNQVIRILGNPPSVAFHDARRTTTDARGEFSFAQRGDESTLVVVDPGGFAQVDVQSLSTNRIIRLQPWARVEGTLKIGEGLGANEIVTLTSMSVPYAWYPREIPAVSFVMSQSTDANGHFVFEQAPPMLVELAHAPRNGSALNLDRHTQAMLVLLKPAETTRVNLGGQGRPVIGHVVIDGTDEPIAWKRPIIEMELAQEGGPNDSTLTNLFAKLRATSHATEGERDRAEQEYQAERKKVATQAREFYASEAGFKQLFASRRYVLQFDDTGAFRAEDIPPGKYRIRWNFTWARLEPILRADHLVVASEQSVEIPPAPKGEPRQPFDLGEIHLQPLPRRK